MKTIQILKSTVNDNIVYYDKDKTRFNTDYWVILDLEVEDDFNVEIDDFKEYEEEIDEIYKSLYN